MSDEATPHRRRIRYSGRNPRRFEDKYKELDPMRHAETVAKVLASGKTPAGTHRPIMVNEIVQSLAPKPGECAVDCTLGHGGHAQALLPLLLPGGRLIGIDADPIELPKTEERLRALGFAPEVFTAHRTNFIALRQVLASEAVAGANSILADLGVSSMQIDNPTRGFSVKHEGPLDMRMNPKRGQPAAELVRLAKPEVLAELLIENADEPHAAVLAAALAGCSFSTTTELADAIRGLLPRVDPDERDLCVRRVFQALRIAVNDEFGTLDGFLRVLPGCLAPGGRVAMLTFHSGEDRRVKAAFLEGFRAGIYAEIAREVIRATEEERRDNPRSTPAKLRWARRA